MKIAISGITLHGNLGGVAMFMTLQQEIRRRVAGAELAVLSISPAADQQQERAAEVKVVAAHWLPLVLVYLPLSVLVAPLVRWRAVRSALRRIAYFRTILDSDLVVDLSGIAFVDGRGLGLLAYNCACCVPALVLNRPVAKLAQTLGPFERPLNRAAARWALRRCAVVVARGRRSGAACADLLVGPVPVRPDTAFCLEVSLAARERAAAVYREARLSNSPLLLSPSRVFELACDRRGVDFVAVCVAVMRRARAAGWPVALLAHSSAGGIAKNDDPAVCQRIRAAVGAGEAPPVLVATDPVQARALIGRAHVFVGSRYHALVSAYAEAVPSVALSWNDKYEDLAEYFDCRGQVVRADRLEPEALWGQVAEVLDRRAALAEHLRQRGPEVRRQAADNFRFLEPLLAAQS